MKTREEIEAKYKKDLAELEREEEIRGFLPELDCEYSVCFYKLYGRSVGIRAEARGYHEQLSLETILAIAEALPAMPLVRLQGRYTTFLPIDCISEYREEDYKEIDHIAPWLITGAKLQDYPAEIELKWFTRLPNGEIADVEIKLPYGTGIRYLCETVYRMGYTTYQNCRLEIDNRLKNIYLKNDRQIAELFQNSVFGGGDGTDKYPRRIVQTWINSDSDIDPTVADFIRIIMMSS